MVQIETIKTDRFEMDYISFGTGPGALVVIPGLGVRSVMLQKDAVADAYTPFTDRYTVYLFDRVKNLRRGYQVSDMADDTAEAMQMLGLSGVHMIGFSQGGMIAMRIAAEHPELVGRMILGSTSAFLCEASREVFIKWSATAAGGDIRKLNREMFRTIYSEEYMTMYSDAFNAMEGEGTGAEMERLIVQSDACLSHDARSLLKKIICPVFVLCSRKDQVFPYTDSEYLADEIGCKLYIYDGYSHAVYDEAPDFKSRMLGFLTE